MTLNASLREKNERLGALMAQANGVVAQHPKGLPAEQKVLAERLLTEAGELKSQIEAERDIERKQADLREMDRFLNDPVNTVPHGANGSGDAERKSFERAGWEFKGGMAIKNTSLGPVEMFDANVLMGDIPEDVQRDPVASEFYRTTRASVGNDYKLAYAKLVRFTARYGPGALSMLSGSEQKALSEGTDTAGGLIVPPDVQSEILARLAQQAVIRSYARVQSTNRDVLRFPAVKANASTYGDSAISGASILSSGFVGGWAGETPAFTDTDLSFQTLDIAIKKVRVATKLSNDFVADAAVNVLAYLAMNGAENMALVEDQGFIQGNGSALVPMGILNAGITTVDIEGSTSDTISNTTANIGSASKLIDLVYKLPAQYTRNARFVMSRNSEGKVRKLVDAQNRFMWPDLAGSNFAGQPGSLMGFPVAQSDWVPNDTQDTVPVIIFGDLSNYIIAQRAQITSVVLRERFADTDQVGIILFERVGGSLFNTDAFRNGIC